MLRLNQVTELTFQSCILEGKDLPYLVIIMTVYFPIWVSRAPLTRFTISIGGFIKDSNMQNSKYLIIVTVALLSLFTKGLLAQDNVPIATLTIGSSANGLSLAERLGYASDTKLLIVHADDIGFSHSANTATMRAFE
ncbi:MAG TPA: hypothetical protein DCY55_02500, partial [Gammaproteobacteria bacterium]|nr:hypothetical protein [Gammaproteobacteria bacterium]